MYYNIFDVIYIKQGHTVHWSESSWRKNINKLRERERESERERERETKNQIPTKDWHSTI